MEIGPILTAIVGYLGVLLGIYIIRNKQAMEITGALGLGGGALLLLLIGGGGLIGILATIYVFLELFVW
jgi:hypothetical protein